MLLSFVLLELHHPAVMLNGIFVPTVNADFYEPFTTVAMLLIGCELTGTLSQLIFEGT